MEQGLNICNAKSWSHIVLMLTEILNMKTVGQKTLLDISRVF